jgi:MoaA/NifB/PqqE/SkfB family radical SAM enzyme
MEWNMFIGACHYAYSNGDILTLGGGEVTLHPRFRDAVTHVLDHTGLNLFMVTNGGKAANGVSKNVRWLIDLMESGIYEEERLQVELSQDRWHDPVQDQYVLRWFTRQRVGSWGHVKTHTRTVTRLIREGRAAKMDYSQDFEWFHDDECRCDDPQIYPDGRIMGCGCEDSPQIGRVVFHGYDKLLDYDDVVDSETRCCSPSKIAMRQKEELCQTA